MPTIFQGLVIISIFTESFQNLNIMAVSLSFWQEINVPTPRDSVSGEGQGIGTLSLVRDRDRDSVFWQGDKCANSQGLCLWWQGQGKSLHFQTLKGDIEVNPLWYWKQAYCHIWHMSDNPYLLWKIVALLSLKKGNQVLIKINT